MIWKLHTKKNRKIKILHRKNELLWCPLPFHFILKSISIWTICGSCSDSIWWGISTVKDDSVCNSQQTNKKSKYTKYQTMRIFNATHRILFFCLVGALLRRSSVRSHLVMLKIRCMEWCYFLALFDPWATEWVKSKGKNRMCARLYTTLNVSWCLFRVHRPIAPLLLFLWFFPLSLSSFLFFTSHRFFDMRFLFSSVLLYLCFTLTLCAFCFALLLSFFFVSLSLSLCAFQMYLCAYK